MDFALLIEKLINERTHLDEIIASLQQIEKTLADTAPPKKRRGRKFMNDAERREVSRRMKNYWAQWHAQKNAQAGG